MRDSLITIVLAMAALALLPLFVDIYSATLLIIYGLLALSLGFIWGVGGILCFGQSAFFGLGAYAFAIGSINFGMPWAAFAISLVIPTAFALIFGALLFYGRLTDVYLAVLTLVVSLILFKYLNATAGSQYVIGEARLGGFNGIPGFEILHMPWDRSDYLYDEKLYVLAGGLLIAAYVGLRVLLASSFGRILVGIRENETRAELVGYDIRIVKTIAFGIGGLLAGLSGALFANWAEIVTPALFSLGQSAEIIIWVIVGGASSLLGPIVGAAILGVLKLWLGQQQMIDNLFVLGSILILTVLFLPKGVVPTIVDFAVGRASRRGRLRRSSDVRGRTRRRQVNARERIKEHADAA